MNADILAQGRTLAAQLDKAEADIRALTAEPPVNEPWPGYTAERARYLDAVLAGLRQVSGDLGTLVTVLAQDGTP